MISYRKADIFERMRGDNNPIGKKMILVPNALGRYPDPTFTVIESDRNSVKTERDNGTFMRFEHKGFLGCRDDMAFYVNEHLQANELVGLWLYIRKNPDSFGKILSADRGILRTESGQIFKAEDFGFESDELDSVTLS